MCLKRFTTLVVLALAALSPAPAKADYTQRLQGLTFPGLGIDATGQALAVSAACGTDTVWVAINAASDTVPFGKLIPLVFISAGGGADYEQQYFAPAEERRGRKGAADYSFAQREDLDIFGAPVALVLTGGVETLSNIYKLVAVRHAQGVDYAATRGQADAAYIYTEAAFLRSFGNKSSICRESLHRLWQVGHEALSRVSPAPKVAADAGRQPKTAPAAEPTSTAPQAQPERAAGGVSQTN